MTIYDVIIKGRIELIARSPASGTNGPPVWDQQPNPVFTNGTADTYDIGALGSDPDDDALTYSLNTGAVSLPTGVTWDAGTGILTYDGAGAVDQTTGHVATLDDGTDTTDSNTFNIQVQAVASAFGFPRIAIHHIGGRAESSSWTDPAFHARLAVADDVGTNFAVHEDATQPVSDIKAINPNVRIFQYSDPSAFLISSSIQLARRDYVVDNFVTPALPGGTATDGMSRHADTGAIIEGWPNKQDVNQTDFPNLFNSQLPMVYAAEEKYKEHYTGAQANVFDDIYYDIWRWYGRYADRAADWNRDGDRYDESPPSAYEGHDPTGNINASYIRTKQAINTMVQANAQSDRGEDIRILGTISSWGEDWDGAQAQNDVITSAPAAMVAITDGGIVENWGKINGFLPDGQTRTGSFERAYKQCQRIVSFINTSTATNTVRVWAHWELQTSLHAASPYSNAYDLAAYFAGMATLAGAYCDWMAGSDHRDPQVLDEYFGQDAAALSTAQKISAMHWMGLPTIAHPEYGQIFSGGVNGGIIADTGVYGMAFDNALLYVNPYGNGNQVISAPTGSWKHITGSQRSVNDGSNVSGTLSIDNGTAIFLEPQ
jgi:hypothetical protein